MKPHANATGSLDRSASTRDPLSHRGSSLGLMRILMVGLLLGTGACDPAEADPIAASDQVQKQTSESLITSRVIVSVTRAGEPTTNEVEVAERAGFVCVRVMTYERDLPLAVFACVRPRGDAEALLLHGALQFGDLTERVEEVRDDGWECRLIAGSDEVDGDDAVTMTVPYQAFACGRSIT